MKEENEKYSRTLTFTATELSLLRQGLQALIQKQRRRIKALKEPYLTTAKNHLQTLTEFEKKLTSINIEIENQVVEDVKAIQKR